MNTLFPYSGLSRRNLLQRGLLLLGAPILVRPIRSRAAQDHGARDPEVPPWSTAQRFVARAFEMKDLAIQRGDQPYGAIVVRGETIIGLGPSQVITENDPTAHAEMVAIREACKHLGTRDLSGCAMYSTSQACAMCETAAYWSNVSQLYYGTEGIAGGAPTYPRC